MKRHPLDPLSLVLGLATLIGGGLWVAWDQGNADRGEILIAVPVILIVGGIVGIVLSTIASHRRKARNE
ncbi:hypothetical protein [Solicola gregarius]|uniref:Uncharacterized protein n=1 Tax=Solicola gregarius TaxID=2908642 RepID=A0AA46TFI7_9ACTN|nr:hypothetical protein [Solicola gregarius]UYM03872.1 hypothetical protein L0C25_15130 [Solicola gregarius]